MRDKWYADNRDLVKWSTLLLLANRYHSEQIFQIAYIRESHYGQIEIDGTECEIPGQFLSHFRDINKITGLSSRPEIVVLSKEFIDRTIYLNAIKQLIKKNVNNYTNIVFLDPDTGLEPIGRSNHNHVLEQELNEIWQELPPNWLLVFYQHKTNRSGDEWVEPKRQQFSEALEIPLIDVKIASAFGIAKDVVFFFAVKQ